MSPVTPTKPTTATTTAGGVPLSNGVSGLKVDSSWGMAVVLTLVWVTL